MPVSLHGQEGLSYVYPPTPLLLEVLIKIKQGQAKVIFDCTRLTKTRWFSHHTYLCLSMVAHDQFLTVVSECVSTLHPQYEHSAIPSVVPQWLLGLEVSCSLGVQHVHLNSRKVATIHTFTSRNRGIIFGITAVIFHLSNQHFPQSWIPN